MAANRCKCDLSVGQWSAGSKVWLEIALILLTLYLSPGMEEVS